MKLAHDIENDLEHTIPDAGDWHSQWLFGAMTGRALALLEAREGAKVLDQACGMGQDTIALSRAGAGARTGTGINFSVEAGTENSAVSMFLGLEPSNRMIRYAQSVGREAAPSPQQRLLFARALAEEMPFREASFDAVLCKGAMDHFMAPRQAMEEAARVLRPGGRMVLALANYDSLSCLLGRWLESLRLLVQPGRIREPNPYFEPPPDHMTRFGFAGIVALPLTPLRVTRVEGVSLLWGFPPWSRLINWSPPAMRRILLTVAFALGSMLPRRADVVIVQATKEAPAGAEQTGKEPH